MNNPKVTVNLNNYQAVYDWYQSYRQPRPITRLAYKALDVYYKPTLHYVDDAYDEFDDFRRDDTPQVFVLNHLTNHSDQFVASAIAHQMTPEDVGHTRVLAKDELFHGTQRHFVDMMGAIPTFRKKDHTDTDIVERAGDALIACTGNIVAAGQNMAVFGEGTHNKVDPLVLQKLRPGFARIALHAFAQGIDVAITPIGMSFGTSLDSLQPRKAVAVITPSIRITAHDTIDTLVDATRELLQSAVTQANAIRAK